jgi:type I restriction enzyme R subunit
MLEVPQPPMTIPPSRKPEDRARADIDRLLTGAGWLIQNRDSIDIEAGRGIAIREFQLAPDHGFADYLLYVDGYAAGVVEAKKAGIPLIGSKPKPTSTAWDCHKIFPRPAARCRSATSPPESKTRFTNLLDPDARSRPVFGFHRPETLATWMEADLKSPGSGLRNQLRLMPGVPRDVPTQPKRRCPVVS